MNRIYLETAFPRMDYWVAQPDPDVYTLQFNIPRHCGRRLWSSKPDANLHRTVVVLDENGKGKEKQIFRTYESFLRIPGYDPNTGKSYMFGGDMTQTEERFKPLPRLHPELEDVRSILSKELGFEFDQCVINWYEPKDYIESHSDCTDKLDPNAPIVSLTYYAVGPKIRAMVFESRETRRKIEIPLFNGVAVVMPPGNQQKFRHSVAGGPLYGRRISVTFRKLKGRANGG